MSRQFLNVSIPDVVKKLKTDEKIALLGAPDWWNTTSISRLCIPAVRMSDGPNGVRGSSHFASTPAQCLPCATSLAATFDSDLIYDVGVLLAEEAKVKSSVILLGPTCNIQRSPLGGRAFESFSEDPTLSGQMASAYVNGLQSNNVAATMKHFVANDQEHERTAADSVVSERALREIYLYPFMLAQRNVQPWAYMTSYGRIGNVHCSENPRLLRILRDEWGFEGIVMSDWFGTYSVDQSLNAGLDLEMPGPPRWRTKLLVHHALSSQKIHPETIDLRVTNLLTFVQKMAKKNPEIVYGDGKEGSRDIPETREFCRRLAADGMVLLKNDENVLPLNANKVKKVAIIGPNAKKRVISGGGSAALKPTYVISPYEGLTQNAPQDIEISYSLGCHAHEFLPTLEDYMTTFDGKPGWLCTFYNHDEQGNPVGDGIAEIVLKETKILFVLDDFLPAGLTPTWTIKLRGLLKIDKTSSFEFGLSTAGRAKLWIDSKLTIDNWTKQRPGKFFLGQGTAEEKAVVYLIANKSVEVLVEYTNTLPPGAEGGFLSALFRGVFLGGCEKIDPDEAIDDAITLASKSDVVIYVGGLTPDYESEGFDRQSLDLPGRQNEVISRIAKANRNTVVCIQAGSAVAMPWVNDVNGIVQAWYSGNEVGNALSDIIYGIVNPSGRLPLSLPARMEDIPAYPNLRSENGKIHYREDIFVGYKHYQSKDIKPLFPFGHGLSYSTFVISDLRLSKVTSFDPSFIMELSVSVKNTGSVVGSEVVQIYVTYPDVGVQMPKLQLRGFAKARDLQPGEETQVIVRLDKYAVSFWDTPKDRWSAFAGKYGIFVGSSSEDLVLEDSFELEHSFYWTGL